MYWAATLKRALGWEKEAKLPRKFNNSNSDVLIRRILSSNPAIQDDQSIVEQLIQHGELVFFREGEPVIKQGDNDNDVYFLLSGEVDIIFKSQLSSKREAPNQVGEMAAMTLGKKRSASVFARTDEVAALKIPGIFFNKLWSENILFQKLLQGELLSRQRERIAVNEVARRNNSPIWLATSFTAAMVSGLISWYFVVPETWTSSAGAALTVFISIAVFIITLLHNPTYFWRRCFGISLLAMIGTFVFDQYISFKTTHGFGSLEINFSSANGETSVITALLSSFIYLCILALCAYMDHLERRA